MLDDDAPERAPLEDDGRGLRPLSLEDALHPPRTRRAMAIRLGVALLAVAGLAGLLAGLVASGRPAATGKPLAFGIMLSTNVSGARAIINGATLSLPLPQLFYPDAGVNDITITAPPFTPRACRVILSVDGSLNGLYNCAGATLQTIGFTQTAVLRSIVVPFLLGDLPANLQTAAAQAMQTTVDDVLAPQAGVVPAGQYYATQAASNGQPLAVALASGPLQATLSATINLDTLAGSIYQDPGEEVPNYFGIGTFWLVGVVAQSLWTFRDGAHLVAGSVPTGWNVPFSLAVRYADGAFTAFVNTGTGNPAVGDLCQTATNTLGQQLANTTIAVQPNSDLGFVGCVLRAVPANGTLSTYDPAAAKFIVRFGAWLTANDAAHALLPSLPAAPPAEVAALGG